MNRRHFLGVSASMALAAACQPKVLFAESRPGYLAGWQGLPDAGLPLHPLDVHGTLPKGLQGTLYRNGPARFERGGLRYRHWFDGDGMIQAWNLNEKSATHRARFVATSKFRQESKAGKFLYSATGTVIPNSRPAGNGDDFNTANTAIIPFGDELLALWEGGSAHAMDPATLNTRGPVTWRDDLKAMPFSAHPLFETDGTLWNFGSLPYIEDGQIVVYQIAPTGKVIKAQLVDAKSRGYAHSFAMTERHLIFIFSPWQLDMESLSGRSWIDAMTWQPEQGSTAVIVDKHDLSIVARHTFEAGLVYHFVDARETAEGIAIRGCWHEDIEFAMRPYAEHIAGRSESRPPGVAHVAELWLPNSRASKGGAGFERLSSADSEFPTPLSEGRFVTVGAASPIGPSGYANSVQLHDTDGQIQSAHRFPEGYMVEEHLVVQSEAGPMLMGTVLDWKNERAGVCVLRADRLDDGPVYEAYAPYTVPLGFHGCFRPG